MCEDTEYTDDNILFEYYCVNDDDIDERNSLIIYPLTPSLSYKLNKFKDLTAYQDNCNVCNVSSYRVS